MTSSKALKHSSQRRITLGMSSSNAYMVSKMRSERTLLCSGSRSVLRNCSSVETNNVSTSRVFTSRGGGAGWHPDLVGGDWGVEYVYVVVECATEDDVGRQ